MSYLIAWLRRRELRGRESQESCWAKQAYPAIAIYDLCFAQRFSAGFRCAHMGLNKAETRPSVAIGMNKGRGGKTGREAGRPSGLDAGRTQEDHGRKTK
ncbi:hypothetical protein TOPH_07039 [Tolypocladium ophioglossoides CBS 100239]|uniref:Uncharacterized protein n=1 Tax=Tolypocladium ophioglossoides (strain CBS 100239) TaxID=1163406 RepID=A0A0L0N2S0_TOLOC|nr:hypothetical protein TOPH_07039 [Tolypocladium ophioglossoides CBS 100239]